jgi:hypothetical protein
MHFAYLFESNYVGMLQRSVVHNLSLNMLINLQKPNNTPESLPSDKIEHQVERNFIKKGSPSLD